MPSAPPSTTTSRQSSKGASWPLCREPILSLYLEQLKHAAVRLWTLSSSWFMKRNCFWAQARPWAGKGAHTH